MLSIIKNFNNLINLVREKTFYFVYSYFFPVLTALISLVFWIADLQIIGLIVVAVIGCFVLIVYDDFLPFAPIMFIIPMCFRDTNEAISQSLAPFIVGFSILVLAIFFNIFRYSIKITLDKFFYMLLGIVTLFVIAGVFAGNFDNYFKAVDLLAISAISPLAIHFFFYNKINLNSKVDYRKYFWFCFICAITLAAVQLFYVYFYVKFIGRWSLGNMPGGFCWANSNHVANIILLAVPLCCYMMLSSKRLWAWFIELIFLYATVFLSGSHGGLATLLVFTPFLMYTLYDKSYRSTRQFLCYAYFILIALSVLALAVLCLFFYDEFSNFIIVSSSGNGRIYPYNVALECFFKNPILGVGFGNGNVSLESIKPAHNVNGLFHSTFFHILACAGLVGIIVYVIYYLVRIKYLAKGNTLLGYFAILSLLMFAVYGMVENSEFNIVLMFMTTIITVVGLMNKKGSDDKPLPLYLKIPNFNI